MTGGEKCQKGDVEIVYVLATGATYRNWTGTLSDVALTPGLKLSWTGVVFF